MKEYILEEAIEVLSTKVDRCDATSNDLYVCVMLSKLLP